MDAMSLLKDDHIPDPSCGSGNPPGRVPQLTSFAASPKPSYSRIVPVTRLSSEKLALSVPKKAASAFATAVVWQACADGYRRAISPWDEALGVLRRIRKFIGGMGIPQMNRDLRLRRQGLPANVTDAGLAFAQLGFPLAHRALPSPLLKVPPIRASKRALVPLK
jgi:hypothetical protein